MKLFIISFTILFIGIAMMFFFKKFVEGIINHRILTKKDGNDRLRYRNGLVYNKAKKRLGKDQRIVPPF